MCSGKKIALKRVKWRLWYTRGCTLRVAWHFFSFDFQLQKYGQLFLTFWKSRLRFTREVLRKISWKNFYTEWLIRTNFFIKCVLFWILKILLYYIRYYNGSSVCKFSMFYLEIISSWNLLKSTYLGRIIKQLKYMYIHVFTFQCRMHVLSILL